ncbi:uncharacterized protein LOC121398936 [Xenopus laevis]|uniref:Uncharacterized protein LOC121398936 n=1 Tax=Xenopus laevis TaxID=8355 RepID=A0A8J1M0I1_XENLA|nr:uncharacterized protein LOC121398936 [Xenopus laevis]
MGAAVAPSFANLFVHKLEQELFLNHRYKNHIQLYLRYMDDILVVWKGDITLFNEMVNEANESHPTVKFTTEISKRTLNFLDVSLTMENGSIITNLYRKATDRNSLLNCSSFHSRKCITGIPKGQFLRARRIASDDAKYWEAAEGLINRFCTKGYSRCTLHKTAAEVGRIPRTSLLQGSKAANKNNRTPFVSLYHHKSDQVEKVIKRFWPILQGDKQLQKFCIDPPLFCYRKGRTIRDHLCTAEPKKETRQTVLFQGLEKKGTFPCLGCVCCSSVIRGESICHPMKGNKIKLKHYATCLTAGVVYLLKCPCGKVYVGQTIRPVKERIKEHKSDIRNYNTNTPTDTSVSRHFFSNKHNQSQLKWLVLEVVTKPQRGGDIKKLLLQREAVWIKRLNSMVPIGLNEYWSIAPFL